MLLLFFSIKIRRDDWWITKNVMFFIFFLVWIDRSNDRCVIDEYPKLLRSKKVIITAVLCTIQFLLGIPFCMQVILSCLIASQHKNKYTYIRRDYSATNVMQNLQYRHKNIANQNASLNTWTNLKSHMWSKPKTHKESLSIYLIWQSSL